MGRVIFLVLCTLQFQIQPLHSYFVKFSKRQRLPELCSRTGFQNSKQNTVDDNKGTTSDPNLNKQCPCESSNTIYAKCCHPLHTFSSHHQTVNQVARARYSAYALGVSQYLVETSHRTQKVKLYFCLLIPLNFIFIFSS